MLYSVIKSIVDTIPEMEKDLMQNKTTVIVSIINRGLTYFKNEANIMDFNGVADDHFDEFLKTLISLIDLPKEYQQNFTEIMAPIIASDFDEWVHFDISYSIKSNAQCKYINVMALHEKRERKTYWLVADIKATFDLAPDIFIIQQESSFFLNIFGHTEQKIVIKPASLPYETIVAIFQYFKIISYERFAEVLNIKKYSGNYLNLASLQATPEVEKTKEEKEKEEKEKEEEKERTKSKDKMERLKDITGIVGNWITDIKTLVDIFKVSQSSEVKQVLESKGFSYFSQTSDSQFILGMDDDYWSTYMKHFFKRIHLPASIEENFAGN